MKIKTLEEKLVRSVYDIADDEEVTQEQFERFFKENKEAIDEFLESVKKVQGQLPPPKAK